MLGHIRPSAAALCSISFRLIRFIITPICTFRQAIWIFLSQALIYQHQNQQRQHILEIVFQPAGQFDALAEELALDGVADRIEAYKDDYQRGILNERGYSIERMFEAAYKMAYPPHGCRGRQHDSWGTCIDIVHAIEHQQWLDSPGEKRESPGTTNRSFKPIPLGHEPFPKIERVEE